MVVDQLPLLKKAVNYITKHKLHEEFYNYCNNEVTNEKIIEFYNMKVGV